jgi:hypothetical protein
MPVISEGEAWAQSFIVTTIHFVTRHLSVLRLLSIASGPPTVTVTRLGVTVSESRARGPGPPVGLSLSLGSIAPRAGPPVHLRSPDCDRSPQTPIPSHLPAIASFQPAACGHSRGSDHRFSHPAEIIASLHPAITSLCLRSLPSTDRAGASYFPALCDSDSRPPELEPDSAIII